MNTILVTGSVQMDSIMWSRAKKEALIRGDIETLKQLSKKKDLS